jgi:hypothetical protein
MEKKAKPILAPPHQAQFSRYILVWQGRARIPVGLSTFSVGRSGGQGDPIGAAAPSRFK